MLNVTQRGFKREKNICICTGVFIPECARDYFLLFTVAPSQQPIS